MTLSDDLKDYIAKNSKTSTDIAEKHSVAIVGETHAPVGAPDKAAARTKTSIRLVLELLLDPKYRYYGSEHFLNGAVARKGVRNALRDGTMPPQFDPDKDGDLPPMEVSKRLLLNRHAPILDNLRKHPLYVLPIGSTVNGSARDARIAQHFLEEMKDRKLTPGIPGVILVGLNHASKTRVTDGQTTRMILEKHAFRCISICKMSDFVNDAGEPDDQVVSTDTALDNIQAADIIRLTTLVSRTPVTVPTDKKWGDKPSPFRSVTLGQTKTSVAEQYEYVVLDKAA
ncbi:MAG TPA: hypothetical protein VKV39_14280 [Candidatus Sulfotelmatobacter sp.]|nr:hypothetical protein [Candidatus Sulfotelmatobacter sp.]